MNFPNDSDGQVLENLHKDGVDFSKPYNVDFCVAVPDKKNGKALIKILKSKGISCELEKDDESKEWTCYCYYKMLLVFEGIIAIQNQLDEISHSYGGYSDGWGVLV